MKRPLAALLAAVCLLAPLWGCAQEEEAVWLQLYLPAGAPGEGALAEAMESRNYYGVVEVESLLTALVDELFAGEAELLGWSLNGGDLRVDLSASYGALAGVERTLAECCIVRTLCQLEEVERVQVTAGGRRVSAHSQAWLTAEDMLFTGAEEEPRHVMVELCFPRAVGRGLGFEVRELILTEDDDLYTAVTRALLAGPESGDLRSPFPEGVELLGTRLEGGVCHVDLSAALLEGETSVEERDLLLYAIVDTLGNLDAVSSVQLLVEGEILPAYGSADTSLPLEPDFGLVADP